MFRKLRAREQGNFVSGSFWVMLGSCGLPFPESIMSTTPEVFVVDKKLGFICAFTAATLMGFVGFFARHINA